jgi:hypothetical protein
VVTLVDAATARAELARDDHCPDGGPDGGTVLLPLDALFGRLWTAPRSGRW